MKFITTLLATTCWLTPFAHSAFAEATIEDASNCIYNLTSAHSGQGAYGKLRDIAADQLDAWLRAELQKVSPERRERVLDAILRTKVDSNVTGTRAAIYDSGPRQIYLRTHGFDRISGLVTLVRQLDHLIHDLDSRIAHWESRMVVRLLDPRSIVFLNQARASRAEYRFLTSLFEKMPPERIYDAIFEARHASETSRELLAKILKVTHVKGGDISIQMTDELAEEIANTFDSNELALKALIRELNSEDLATIIRVERASESRFVNSHLWRRYKAMIAGEYALKSAAYGLYATAVLSLLH